MWLKWDDQAFDNRKMIAATCEQKALHWSALTFAAQQLTDGHIPATAIALITCKADPRLLADMSSHVDRLVELGLWDRDDAGELWVHDFLDWNPPGAVVREQRRIRQAAGRKGAAIRWNGKRHD
jgi:hypothetical protein